MENWVSQDAVRAARRVNLYDYLSAEHPNEVTYESGSLRLNVNHSVSIRNDYTGYYDFATGEKGNSVDCLVNYFGYDFKAAVTALCEFAGIDPQQMPATIDLAHPYCPQFDPKTKKWYEKEGGTVNNTPVKAPQTPHIQTKAQVPPPRKFEPPNPFNGPYSALFDYLSKTRGIPTFLIQKLIDWGQLYQEGSSGHGNAVFIDPARTFYEVRGTGVGKPFHQVQFSDPDAFWWFKPDGPGSDAVKAFICESSIDAISLYLLHNPFLALFSPAVALNDDPLIVRYYAGKLSPGNYLYCSIGGVGNQRRIDAIKAGMSAAGCPVFLAVDNDEAGEQCRQRNGDLRAVIPRGCKDWNEILLRDFRDELINEWSA